MKKPAALVVLLAAAALSACAGDLPTSPAEASRPAHDGGTTTPPPAIVDGSSQATGPGTIGSGG